MEDLAKTPASSEKSDRIPLGVGLGYVALLAAFTIFCLYLFRINVLSIQESMIRQALGVMSLVILMSLANAYLYAYRLYEERFYLLVSIGWFANALYLVFEFFPTPQTLRFRVLVFVFALVTNIPFYIAVFTGPRVFRRKSFLLYSILWGSVFVASPAIASVSGELYGLSDQYRFMIFALGGIAFSTWLFLSVGRRLSERLNVSIQGRAASILPWTFYIYAGLQITYFGALVPEWKWMFLAAFIVAFLLKVVNTVSIISILTVTRREFFEIKALLEQRSVLEEIGRIASSIEHDIKTPLGIMSLEIGRMRSKFQADENIVEALERIEEERKRIFAISQVVPYLRGDKEFYERYMEKTDILEVVHKAMRNVKKDLKLDPAKFYFRVTGRELFVKCHRSMLQQAIVNILKNSVEAVEAAKRKTGVIEISLSPRKQDRTISLEVNDNGCGIHQDELPHLTTLYTTKAHVKANSGIGLFIVEKIIRMHDGTIEITSELGKCTTVRVLLPEWVEPQELAEQKTSPARSGLNPAPA